MVDAHIRGRILARGHAPSHVGRCSGTVTGCGRNIRLRHQEDFSCIWISHSGSCRKRRDVDVISFRRIRTGYHTFVAGYRNPVRQIPFCFFRWDRRRLQHSDIGSGLFFFNEVGWLFQGSRRRFGRIGNSRTRTPGYTFRLFVGRIGRWARLESFRNRLANLFEKISHRIGVHTWTTYKKQHRYWQRNPARSDKAFDWVLGVQSGDEIFPQSRGFMEAKFSCTKICPLLKTDNATGATAGYHRPLRQRFRCNRPQAR